MTKLIIGLIFFFVIAAGYLLIVKPCIAGWCYGGQCINSSICGSGCVCLKRNLELSGYCYSVE